MELTAFMTAIFRNVVPPSDPDFSCINDKCDMFKIVLPLQGEVISNGSLPLVFFRLSRICSCYCATN